MVPGQQRLCCLQLVTRGLPQAAVGPPRCHRHLKARAPAVLGAGGGLSSGRSRRLPVQAAVGPPRRHRRQKARARLRRWMTALPAPTATAQHGSVHHLLCRPPCERDDQRRIRCMWIQQNAARLRTHLLCGLHAAVGVQLHRWGQALIVVPLPWLQPGHRPP